jgi:hypothetical protein
MIKFWNTFENAKIDSGLAGAEIRLATFNFNSSPSAHNGGGNMNSGSGGRRSVRNSRSDKIHREILEEMGTWENREEYSTWVCSK